MSFGFFGLTQFLTAVQTEAQSADECDDKNQAQCNESDAFRIDLTAGTRRSLVAQMFVRTFQVGFCCAVQVVNIGKAVLIISRHQKPSFQNGVFTIK